MDSGVAHSLLEFLAHVTVSKYPSEFAEPRFVEEKYSKKNLIRAVIGRTSDSTFSPLSHVRFF